MVASLTSPTDTTERQNQKLLKITEVLMRRVEQATDDGGAAYAQFQRAVMLEDQVKARTRDLEHTLDLLNDSNRRLAESINAAETARADLSNAIETIQEGFALFGSDEALILCNSRFGMHMPDLRRYLQPGLTFPDYVNKVSRSDFLVLPEGTTSEDWAADRMRRHLDRHVVFNVAARHDRWIQVSEHRTPTGKTVIMQTDVTDIVRLERQERGKLLDDQARLIRATLDHIGQGVCIFDKERRLAGWNAKVGAMLSIPVGRFRLGADFDLLFEQVSGDLTFGRGVDKAQFDAWVHQVHRRRPLSFELQSKSGAILDVFAQEIPDRGFVVSFSDITAERMAVRALADAKAELEQRVLERTLDLEDALADAERANSSKSRFVAAASHDLLQPLSAAKLYISSLRNEDLDPLHREIVHKTQNALASAEDLIGALLDISKLESGKAAVDISAVDIGKVLRQLDDEFAPLAAQKGLELRVRPTDLTLRTDARYIRRILQNLISNAIRYTESGKILVGVRRIGKSLRLEVWDTGPGIPEDDQEKVFQEFQRLNARASAGDGLGLGLAIVERACALLGHPLSLRSIPGRGTVFTVTVPLAKPVRQGLRLRAAPDLKLPSFLRGLIILLVENDAELRSAMTLLLETWGVEVLAVAGGDEALALLEEIQLAPDALLVDYQLDDEIGLDVIARLRERFGPLPARIVTADHSAEVAAACAAARVDVLQKPVGAHALEVFLAGVPKG